MLELQLDRHDTLIEYIRKLKDQGMTGEQIRKYIGWFIENKARNSIIPIHGTFELTPFCNLNCHMCYVHLDRDDYNRNLLISASDWKTIIEQGYKVGMRTAVLTGGECLVYPDFDEIFLFLCQLGVDVAVLTNGVLMNNERINFFKENRLSYIQVSLYGSNEESYEKVTGHRVFKTVLRNLQLMREAGLKVQLSITPSRFMLNDMYALVELAHSLGFPYEINCRLMPPRKNTGRKMEDLSLDQYVDIYRIRAGLLDMNLEQIDPAELPDENRSGKEWHGLLCGAGRSSFAIRYDGQMIPCVSLDDHSVSVLDLGFQKSWELISQYAINYPIPCECNGCIYFPICIHCQGLHKSASVGHCDSQICERTKKLAEAGFFHFKKNSAEQKI